GLGEQRLEAGTVVQPAVQAQRGGAGADRGALAAQGLAGAGQRERHLLLHELRLSEGRPRPPPDRAGASGRDPAASTRGSSAATSWAMLGPFISSMIVTLAPSSRSIQELISTASRESR